MSMLVTRSYTFMCDGLACHHTTDSYPVGSAGVARREAFLMEGWKRVGRLDLCPSHQADES